MLNVINNPSDLRQLSHEQLKLLSVELRAFILDSVSRTGGHLSSNLGTVELTIALHYVFNTPEDRLVWDVGHQTYPHKILTGRRNQMSSLRQHNGISGFPCRTESEYDTFGTAHSSTSISAALGMALAAYNIGKKRRYTIAVIGDGAMTAGMAFEGMNNAGIYKDINFLIILNDNDMSISPPVGALNRYLARLMSGQFYAKAKRVSKSILPSPVLKLLRRFKKIAVPPATLFEEFGFNYMGPIDGHDLDSLIPTLENIKNLTGPQFLHVVTKKGQGYKLAEVDPVLYHGPGKFNVDQGIQKSLEKKITYTQVFGNWLCDMAHQDNKLIGITPAMREGSGMVEFERRFPTRYYDVGIAEQHAVTFAAGMACEGLKPVVAIYSTFLQRAYDQLIHDVALQNLDVTFALDRAGLVGADGATHAGNYDLAYLRCIPNIVIMAASDETECRKMLSTAYWYPGPAVVRYPRGTGLGVFIDRKLVTIPLGRGEVCRSGKHIAILAFGTMLIPSLSAANQIDATVVNMRFVKPIDVQLIRYLALYHDAFVTIEEGCIMGGAGSAVAETLATMSIVKPILHLGIPDRFIHHGDVKQLLIDCGLDATSIVIAINVHFNKFRLCKN